MDTVPPSIAQLAAQALLSRRESALRSVKTGGMHPAEAQRRLAPWLAIACLCGIDLPEIEEQLAALRCRDDGPDEADTFTDAQARGVVAEWICPRARWAVALARARDAALNRAEASAASPRMPAAAVEADAAAARDLRALAEALEFDAAGRCPVPPYRPATPALETAA